MRAQISEALGLNYREIRCKDVLRGVALNFFFSFPGQERKKWILVEHRDLVLDVVNGAKVVTSPDGQLMAPWKRHILPVSLIGEDNGT